MTGWAGPGHDPAGRESLGLIDSVAVIVLPWLDRQAEPDPPCLRGPEAGR
jgi:hypothetical protein